MRQIIIATFHENRDVFVDGTCVGITNKELVIGEVVVDRRISVTLGGAQNFSPPSYDRVLTENPEEFKFV